MRNYTKLFPGPTVVQENGYTHSNGKVLTPSEDTVPTGWKKVRVGYPCNEWYVSAGEICKWDNVQWPVDWGMQVIVEPVRSLRRRVFVETGEVRPVRVGEWYGWPENALFKAGANGEHPFPIWREETPTEGDTV